MNGPHEKKHNCPECGCEFTAEVVRDGDTERLELQWTGSTGPKESDDERFQKRVDEQREQWRRDWEAERSERSAKNKSGPDFIL